MARLYSQALLPGRVGPRDPHGVVHRMVAIQAQHPPAVPLAIRARCPHVERDDVTQAVADGRLVKTWGPRGTLHLLAAEDAGWILRLVSPGLVAKGRRRLTRLGVDADGEERAAKAIVAALEDGPLARADIRDHLRRDGFDVDTDRQTVIHLIQRTALRGAICFAPAGDDTFMLARDVLPPDDGPDGDDALDELARRYLAGHAPATADDFAAWSGLPIAQVRSRWPTGVVPSAPAVDGPVVTLLPHFDCYLLGYADRRLVLNPEHAPQVQRGGGWIHPVVLVDGEVVGTWSVAGPSRSVVVELFTDLDSPAQVALRSETAAVERFVQA